jgi:hypothetical protein
MANLTFPFPLTGTLKEAFEEMPEGFRSFVREGFSQWARVSDDKWDTLLPLVAGSLEAPSDMEVEYVGRRFGIPEDNVLGMIGAARVLCGVLVSRSEGVNEVVEAAVASKSLERSDAERIRQLGERAVGQRSALKRRFEESSLRGTILPSVTELDFRIDLRLHFEGDRASHATPVVIARLADAGGDEHCFQLSPFQIEALLSSVQEIARQLKQAESIATKAL